MFDYIKIIVVLIIYFVIFGVPLYLLYKLPMIIRMIRMKNLAKKFGLKYEKSVDVKKFEQFYSGKGKRNRISGIIKNNKIEIYDQIKYRMGEIVSHDINKHRTVIIINESKNILKGSLDGIFRVRITELNKRLNLLNEKIAQNNL